MRKLATVVATMALAFSLGACGGSGGSGGEADKGDAAQEQGAEEAKEEPAKVTEEPAEAEEEAQEESRLVYEGDTMRVWYEGTQDLAPMGLDGMLQVDLTVENLSDQDTMVAPVPDECVCNGYNVTMTGGALTVSPGNKAVASVQLAYANQTDAKAFEDVTTLTVLLRQTGDDVLSPLADAVIDLTL